MTESYNGITVVSKQAKQHLNPRQLTSYREHRKQLIEWMLNLGKNPSKAEGYVQTTTDTRAPAHKFYRWIWQTEGGV